MQSKLVKKSKVLTVVNNATFSATVTGPDMDLTDYSNILITVKTGTATTSPTLDVAFFVKDTNGNYIRHTSLTQITTATTGYEEVYGLAGRTGRIVCTYGGSGNFATTTVEATMSN